MMVVGIPKIGFYLVRDVQLGEELLFNYSDKYDLPWLRAFNKRILEAKRKKETKAKPRDLFASLPPVNFLSPTPPGEHKW
jgi:hypothetical protein